MLSYYKKSLLGFFNRIQYFRINSSTEQNECLRIQNDLVRKVIYIEKQIRTQRKLIKLFSKKLREINQIRLGKNEAREIKNKILSCHYKIKEYQRLLIILKEIGDAIAFIFIDKWDIKPLAFKESSGSISGKEGLRLEWAIVKMIFKKGKIGILNDITNCLRYGDVTLIMDKGIFIPIEAKSKQTENIRTKRQEAKLRKITNYIYKDKADELYGQKVVARRKSLHSAEINYLDKLNELIKKANEDGAAYSEIEKGLFYYVETKEKVNVTLEQIIKRFTNPPMVEFVNEFKQKNVGYYPFTLSINDAEALYKFYNGEFLITILLDPSVIIERFKTNGFDVEFIKGKEYFLNIKNHAKSHHPPFQVSHHFFARVFAEFVSLDWIIGEVIIRAQECTASY